MNLLSRVWVGLGATAVLAVAVSLGSASAKSGADKSGASRPKGTKPVAEQTARQVDELIAAEVFKPETKLAPRVDDATYLRRVWLDIVGDIPTPEHITAFVLDPAKDKRERIVNELLEKPQ